MERHDGHEQSGQGVGADEWARRLTIFLGAPLALLVSALAILQLF